MAILKKKTTGEKIVLHSHHVFGRYKAGTNTLLENPYISNIHASIRWEKETWRLLDHSRNGTWVDGIRITNGQSQNLKQGQEIRFGGPKEEVWSVIDLRTPMPMLSPFQGKGPIIELKRFQALPNEEEPKLFIYCSSTNQWICENEGGESPLNEGDFVQVDGQIWHFFNAHSVFETSHRPETSSLERQTSQFHFKVSLDEEHVFLEFQHGTDIYDLKERSHHYLLLLLARQRLADHFEGGDTTAHGWMEVDELANRLNFDQTYLNILIFRIRKQLDQALSGTLELPQVIERRFREIRFAYPSFQIFHGSTIEGELQL